LVKVLYSAFVAVLVPVYWTSYGPENFLYFCDIALLITVPALWRESALLASAPTVGILIPQILWMVDFLGNVFGLRLTGMTDYMFRFDNAYEFFTRFLSFFHFWLPILLVWMVFRLGYDRRAFAAWTVLAWIVLVICYVWMPGPSPSADVSKPVNINYVYGFSSTEPQSYMHADVYFAVFTAFMTFAIFWPTHWVLGKVCPRRAA
jgi:hypothetical protein